jgi:hypothetical protein
MCDPRGPAPISAAAAFRDCCWQAFATGDPVVTTGTGDVEIGKMLGGFVRPR